MLGVRVYAGFGLFGVLMVFPYQDIILGKAPRRLGIPHCRFCAHQASHHLTYLGNIAAMHHVRL